MRASQEGHVDISKLLIAAGADVNRKNYEGRFDKYFSIIITNQIIIFLLFCMFIYRTTRYECSHVSISARP